MTIQILFKARILSIFCFLWFVSGCSDFLADFAGVEGDEFDDDNFTEQVEPLTAEQKLAIAKGVTVHTGALKDLTKTSPLYLESVKEQKDTDALVASLQRVVCKKDGVRPKQGGYKCVSMGMNDKDITEIWLLGAQGERLLKATSYDFSKYRKLKVIHVNLGKSPETKIDTVEVRNNRKLESFVFINQNLKALTFAKTGALRQLIVPGNEIENIDLSPYEFLNEVDVSHNDLIHIRIRNLKYLSIVDVSHNHLPVIRPINLEKLKKLDVSENELTELDLHYSPLITHLDVHQNRLRSINLSNQTKLRVLRIHKNALSEIDLDSLYSLIYLDVSRNILKVLHISNLKQLQEMYAGDNPLRTLEVSNLPSLKVLNVELAGLQHIVLHGLPELQELILNNNDLADIDIHELQSLEKFHIYRNKLGVNKPHYEIDLRHLDFIKDVDIRDNPNLDAVWVTAKQEKQTKIKADEDEHVVVK